MNAHWPVLALALVSTACGAVFPEISPPVKAPPAGREMAPPPEDMLFVSFIRADIPSRTRDGRKWDSIGGSLPDPFAKLLVDDREVIRTPIQSDTLTPTWPDQKRANYHIPKGAHVRLELWDSNPISNHPICLKSLQDIHEAAGPAPLDIECDSGAHVQLKIEPAHPRWGLGFYYELQTTGVAVTRVLQESPAARAGLKRGDEIVEIQGKRVKGMDSGETQSLVNANAQIGIEMLIRTGDHAEHRVTVKEGVIYPAIEDGIAVE